VAPAADSAAGLPDAGIIGQPAGPEVLLQAYVALPDAPAQFAVRVTGSAGNGAAGNAPMLHVSDWQVSVKLDPFCVIPHDPQFGSLKVIVAAPCAYTMLNDSVAKTAATVIARMIRVMAWALVKDIALRGRSLEQLGKAKNVRN
jgi:hypothetical protein